MTRRGVQVQNELDLRIPKKFAKVSEESQLQSNVNGNSMIQSIPLSLNKSQAKRLSRELFKEDIAYPTVLKNLKTSGSISSKFCQANDRVILNEMSIVSKEKSMTLADQLDEIDAEFDNSNGVNVVAPDGIQMHVDPQHEHEFSDNEELDYEEDETIETLSCALR